MTRRSFVHAMTPLFIPLKTAYFQQFRHGLKDVEIRRYGPRWNERTCVVGRPVVISHGYQKRGRINGRVRSLHRAHAHELPPKMRGAVHAVYGTLDIDVLLIGVTIEGTQS